MTEDDPDTDGPIDLGALARAARAEMQGGPLPASAGDAARLTEHPGDVIDRYELVERLGEGGMGAVWLAEQREPIRRRVALKVIKLGMDTERVVARFESERQALARMEHPHIAAVLDGGATEAGRPYFVMELVDGEPITSYCDRNGLRLEDRLDLFLQVCGALQHAHQKGVVHRDIKPSNVLVTTVDGAPHAKVIDFGIAKVTDDGRPFATQLTEKVEVVGTLEYMSPEQASGGSQDVDTRADVYSLGVLLYELLTGERPFEFGEARRLGVEVLLSAIRDNDPQRPSLRVSPTGRGSTVVQRPGIDARRLRVALEGELDWIALKALEKDRERRYASAAGLADDVERFLRGETIEARPPSRRYRVRKFVGRNRGAVVAAAAMVALLALGAAGTGYGLWKSLRANDEAERQLVRAAETNRVLSNMLTSVAPRLARGKDTELLVGVLDDTSRRLRDGDVEDPIVAAGLDLEIGDGYVGLGRLAEARVHMERAVEQRSVELGDADVETLRARTRLAHVQRLMQDVEPADENYRAALAGLRDAVGDEHPLTLAARRGLGSLLHRAGRIDEAHEILSEGVAIERRVLTDEQRATTSTLAELATLELFARQDLARAKELFDEALDLVTTHEGDDHPWALRYTESLSQIEAQLGNLDRSLEMCEELSEQYERIYGPDHPETLAAEGNRAFTLGFAGQLEEAEAMMREVLERQLDVLGPDDPGTLWTRAQIAVFDARAGRFDEAAAALEDVVAKVEASGVPALEQRFDLASAYRQGGDPDRARELLEESLPMFEAALGPDDPRTRRVVAELESLRADD